MELVLKDPGTPRSQSQGIYLVSAPPRILEVWELLADFFDDRELNKSNDSAEVVTCGIMIKAGTRIK